MSSLHAVIRFSGVTLPVMRHIARERSGSASAGAAADHAAKAARATIRQSLRTGLIPQIFNSGGSRFLFRPVQDFRKRLSEDPFLVGSRKEVETAREMLQTLPVSAGEPAQISTPQKTPRTKGVVDAPQMGIEIGKGERLTRKTRRR